MKKIKIIFLSWIGRLLNQLLFSFNKINITGEEHLNKLIKSNVPIMVCVWHGRLIFPSWYLRLITTNVYAIASRHTDAEIMGRILSKWGYSLIRGSTKKGGKEVVREMGNIFKNNGIIAITNDGPKGPPNIAKGGSVSTAIKYNAKIITITGSATKYWQMKSWDKFMLPKPFGKIQIIISDPINFNTESKSIESKINILSKVMNEYQNKVDLMTKYKDE
tara:strand:- start:2093 stop:2749 length:657 start_codon:yes stop_codon:yes gene_type:complete